MGDMTVNEERKRDVARLARETEREREDGRDRGTGEAPAPRSH
jgi:hypothetical protein